MTSLALVMIFLGGMFLGAGFKDFRQRMGLLLGVGLVSAGMAIWF